MMTERPRLNFVRDRKSDSLGPLTEPKITDNSEGWDRAQICPGQGGQWTSSDYSYGDRMTISSCCAFTEISKVRLDSRIDL